MKLSPLEKVINLIKSETSGIPIKSIAWNSWIKIRVIGDWKIKSYRNCFSLSFFLNWSELNDIDNTRDNVCFAVIRSHYDWDLQLMLVIFYQV